MEILIITGPPYSGKGTQCELLKKRLGYAHISTGERIRSEKEENTDIGQIMKAYEESGVLVPEPIMRALIEKIIDENLAHNGIILDGYPRTVAQVDTIQNLITEKGLELKAVINIQVPEQELLARARKRAESSGRKDDINPQIHLQRIEVFESSTRPAIEYMKQRFRVIDIDGLGSIEEITKAIETALER